jgi:tagatose 1,6-diphosphate aldolase
MACASMFSHLEDADLTLQLTELAPHVVHRVPTWHFRMLHSRTGEELGGINLRIGSTPHIERYAGHIGFTVHPAHRGHRYAARSVRLLMPVAEQLGFETIWMTCDPENAASRRSLELAGAHLVEIVDVPEDCIIHRSGHKKKCRYLLAPVRQIGVNL